MDPGVRYRRRDARGLRRRGRRTLPGGSGLGTCGAGNHRAVCRRLQLFPHWQGWRHKKRHRTWVARFIASWQLREKLASVESIPDVWQRITVCTMADTLAADREAILLQGGGASGEVPARLLIDALTAVGTYARAATLDPDLQAAARQAVDRFSELAGRRREHTPLSDPPSVPGQQLRRRRNGTFNDAASLPE